MLNTGSKTYGVDAPRGVVTIRCDSGFRAYGLIGKEKAILLGPQNSTNRVLRVDVEGIDAVHVEADDNQAFHDFAFTPSSRYEKHDPTPVEIPLGLDRPETLEDIVRRFVRHEASIQAEESGHETFQEANDFDVSDEDEFKSPYELSDMQEEYPISAAEPPEPPAEPETPRPPENAAEASSEESGVTPPAPIQNRSTDPQN